MAMLACLIAPENTTARNGRARNTLSESNGRGAIMVVSGLGSGVPLQIAGDVWRYCMAVPFSLAGVVTISHMTARAKQDTVGC
jgi:hypothetical protein